MRPCKLKVRGYVCIRVSQVLKGIACLDISIYTSFLEEIFKKECDEHVGVLSAVNSTSFFSDVYLSNQDVSYFFTPVQCIKPYTLHAIPISKHVVYTSTAY